jgi:hypothetical protein
MLEDPDCKPAPIKPANKYNTVLVFGEGPLKPVLIGEELSLLQKTLWPLDHHKSAAELDFHVMQNPQHLSQLEQIMTDKLLSQSEKMKLVKDLRKKWQWIGWYTVKKWGRHNAMAAGNLLLHGKTEKVILSGGRTFPKWYKLATDQYEHWPSEAEMMADIIIQYYGSLYYKKFGKHIEDTLCIENKSTNTLENFAFTLKAHPHLLSKKTKIGLLSAGHHLRRISILAERFSLSKEIYDTQSAQEVIVSQDTASISAEEKALCSRHEELFIRALTKPQYLTYWLGYIPLAENPIILQNTLNLLKKPAWKRSTILACKQVKIEFEEMLHANFSRMLYNEPQLYHTITSKLKQLRKPAYRTFPLS